MGVTRTRTSLQAVPLELDGKLDPSKSWDVKFILNGEEKIIKVCEDTSALEAAENSFDDVESSCRNGVCTTCAARVSKI
jgi:ferredoxin